MSDRNEMSRRALETELIRIAFVALLPVGISGCLDGGDRVAGGTLNGAVRDSAGVRIVEHEEIPGSLPAWTVADAPSLSIGAVDGPGPELFTGVPELVVRSDGSIVVVDRGPGELRAFDASGRHLWTAGRRGDGPGEFSGNFGNFTIYVGLLPGDSILTWDLGNRRLQVFDPGGVFRRSFVIDASPNVASPEVGPRFEGTLSGGVIVMRNTLAGTTEVANAGYMSPITFFGLHDRDGATLSEVGRYPQIARSFERYEGGTRSTRVRLGSDVRHAVGGGAMVSGTQGRIDMQYFGSDGALTQVLRVNSPPVPVDQGMRDASLEEALAGFVDLPAEMRARMEEQYRRAEVAETLPTFDGLMLDAGRRLWLEDYVPPWEDRLAEWTVFSAEGTILAKVTMPEDFTPHHIAGDSVVGVWLNELDVPFVQVRSIVAVPAPGG